MQALQRGATGNLCGVESVPQIRRGKEEQGVGALSSLSGLFCIREPVSRISGVT